MEKRKSKTGGRQKKNAYALVQDVFMIAVGIAVAVFLSKAGIIDMIVVALQDYYIFASFFAGLFFTSAFTLAPASIALIHISQNAPLPSVVLWGGIGAMCGDLLLYFFIKDRFAKDLMSVIKPSKMKYLLRSMHFGFLKWLSPVLGALIIASPLPDEFGITLLGMSKMRLAVFVPVTLFMNMLGIYLLIQFSHLL